MNEVEKSNLLPELAHRIRVEHQAVKEAMQRGAEHAMAAGDFLIEAKARLKHGEWLSWLRDHCSIASRTAQLYMRLAQARPELEANAQRVADLSLRGAVAMLAPADEREKILNRIAEADALMLEAITAMCEDGHAFAIMLYRLPAHQRSAFLDERTPSERRMIRAWRKADVEARAGQIYRGCLAVTK